MTEAQGGVSDEALLQQVMTGDAESFRAFMARHERALYGMLFRMLNDAQRAEDLVQEAFLIAYRALADGAFAPDKGSPRAWMHTVAANLARNELKRRALRPAPAAGVATTKETAADASMGAESAELRAAIEAMLRRLPETERLAVILYDLQGLTFYDVGRAMDCSERSARRYVNQGRLSLARRLREAGFAD